MSTDLISMHVDSRAVSARIRRLIPEVKTAKNRALQDVAEEALRLSQFEVPHDEGTLQNSGTVEVLGDSVVMGYHTKYAARLHEHPEYNFRKGRKGKYIEDPIRNNRKVLNQMFGRAFEMRFF